MSAIDANQLATIITALTASLQADAPASPHVGKKCVIRCYASGVHFGTLVSQNGRVVELSNSRRLWRWDAKETGVSLSEVAMYGGADGRHKFCETLPELTLLDALEVIPASPAAIAVIEDQPAYKPS